MQSRKAWTRLCHVISLDLHGCSSPLCCIFLEEISYVEEGGRKVFSALIVRVRL